MKADENKALIEAFMEKMGTSQNLDVWEKREGEWKLLHRVVAGDLDRWVHTLKRSMARTTRSGDVVVTRIQGINGLTC